MESTVPATDVHQGLAWAYVLNYLSVVLDGEYKNVKLMGWKQLIGLVDRINTQVIRWV